MKISDTITEKILTDNNFSMELAKKIGIQQGSLLSSIRRNRDSRILRLWEAVMFYKEQGYTEEEIFSDYIESQNIIKDIKMNREQFLKVIFFLRYEDIIDNIENIFRDKIPQEELNELKKDIQIRYEQWYDRIPLGDMISPYIWLAIIPQIGTKNRDILLEYIENMEL